MVTVTELRKEAAKQNIKGRSTMTKVELCAALKNKDIVFDDCEKGARKKSPSKKTKKSPAKKSSTKKFPAKKFPAKKSPAKKSPAKKSSAKKFPAKKSSAKKSPAKKSPPRSPRLSPKISPLPSDGKIKAYLRKGNVLKVSKGVYDMVREILIREKITQKNAEAFIVKLGKITRLVSVHAGRVTALIKDVNLTLEILDFMKRDYSNEDEGELSMEQISVLLQKGGGNREKPPPHDVLVIIKRHETLKKNSKAFFSDLGRIIHLLAEHAGRMTPTRMELNLALRFYERNIN